MYLITVDSGSGTSCCATSCGPQAVVETQSCLFLDRQFLQKAHIVVRRTKCRPLRANDLNWPTLCVLCSAARQHQAAGGCGHNLRFSPASDTHSDHNHYPVTTYSNPTLTLAADAAVLTSLLLSNALLLALTRLQMAKLSSVPNKYLVIYRLRTL